MSRPPVHTIRMGLVKASIWKNETKVGTRHQVTVCRLFKNGDIWQESPASVEMICRWFRR